MKNKVKYRQTGWILLFLLFMGQADAAIFFRGNRSKQLEARYDSCRQVIATKANKNATQYMRCAYIELEIGNQLRNEEMIIQGWIDLGRSFSTLKKYDMALAAAHKALLFLQDAGTQAQKADANRLTGAIYTALENEDVAEKYLDDAYAWYLEKADTVNLIKTMGEIAILHGQRKDYDKCIVCLNEIYWLTYKYGIQRLRLITLLNLSLAYQYSGKPDQGLHTLERLDLEFPDSIASRPKYRMTYFLNRGELLAEKNRVEEAIDDFEAGLAIAETAADWNIQIDFLKNLASASLQKQDYEKLSVYYRKLLTAQDSLDANMDKNRIAERELIYDITKKNKQLEQLEARMKRSRMLTVVVIAGSALLLGLWYTRYRIKAKTHAENMEKWSKERRKDNETITDMAIYFHELQDVIMQVVKNMRDIGERISEEGEKKAIRYNCSRLTEVLSDNKTLPNNFADARYSEFLQRLSRDYPDLTASEKRICAMLLVGFTSKDIANVLKCSDRTLNNRRSAIRKKLGISTEKTILDFLKSL